MWYPGCRSDEIEEVSNSPTLPKIASKIQNGKAETVLLAMRMGILPNKIKYQCQGCQLPEIIVLWVLEQLQWEDSVGQALIDLNNGGRVKKQRIKERVKWFANGWNGSNLKNGAELQIFLSLWFEAISWKVSDVWIYLGENKSLDQNSGEEAKEDKSTTGPRKSINRYSKFPKKSLINQINKRKACNDS